MNRKLKHVSKELCLNQGIRPICGIYAFLNGFYDGENKFKWIKLANDLWKVALCKQISEGKVDATILRQQYNGYSIAGEFFSSDNLADFFKEAITVQILSKNSIRNYCIKKYTPHDLNFNQPDSLNKKSFYIIPINSTHFKESNRQNMHWICLRYDNKKWRIYNSSDLKFEDNAKKNSNLYMSKGAISSFVELQKVWENMYYRESKYEQLHSKLDLSFDFGLWPKCQKIPIMTCWGLLGKGIIWKRYKKIWRRHCNIEYSFKNGKFEVIEIKKNKIC